MDPLTDGDAARMSKSRGSIESDLPLIGGGRFHPIPGVKAYVRSADLAPAKGDESELSDSAVLLRGQAKEACSCMAGKSELALPTYLPLKAR